MNILCIKVRKQESYHSLSSTCLKQCECRVRNSSKLESTTFQEAEENIESHNSMFVLDSLVGQKSRMFDCDKFQISLKPLLPFLLIDPATSNACKYFPLCSFYVWTFDILIMQYTLVTPFL